VAGDIGIFEFFESIRIGIGHNKLCLGVQESPGKCSDICTFFWDSDVG
jgi:hypothetical protein